MNDSTSNLNGDNWRNPDGTMKEGHPGLPNAGRPKKKSFRDYFTEAEEEEVMERVKQALSEKEILKMVVEQLFGKPKQPLTGGDEGDNPIPIKIYGGESLSRHASNQTDIQSEEED